MIEWLVGSGLAASKLPDILSMLKGCAHQQVTP